MATAAPVLACLRCVSPIPEASPQQLAAFDPAEHVTIDGLRAGRRLYVAKCGGCHGLYPPRYGGTEEWRAWIHDMAPRARIGPPGEREILLYLRGASRQDPPMAAE